MNFDKKIILNEAINLKNIITKNKNRLTREIIGRTSIAVKLNDVKSEKAHIDLLEKKWGRERT